MDIYKIILKFRWKSKGTEITKRTLKIRIKWEESVYTISLFITYLEESRLFGISRGTDIQADEAGQRTQK